MSALLAVVCWLLINPRNHDPYVFLKGHPIIDVAVSGPGSWGPSETRTYSWKESWRAVAGRAGPELKRLGMQQVKSRPGHQEVNWISEPIDGGPCGVGAEVSVYIVRGRSREITADGPLTDDDPDWVTVFVNSDIEDTWVNIVRYTFFAMP